MEIYDFENCLNLCDSHSIGKLSGGYIRHFVIKIGCFKLFLCEND